mgnify:CR=1 FL=1
MAGLLELKKIPRVSQANCVQRKFQLKLVAAQRLRLRVESNGDPSYSPIMSWSAQFIITAWSRILRIPRQPGKRTHRMHRKRPRVTTTTTQSMKPAGSVTGPTNSKTAARAGSKNTISDRMKALKVGLALNPTATMTCVKCV